MVHGQVHIKMKIIFLASFVILAVYASAHTNDINNQRIYPSDYQAQRIYPSNSQAQRRWFGDEEEETDFRRRNVSKVTTEHTYVHEERPKEQCLKITQNVAFEFLNFGIFHQFLSY